jgi:hypothetical protein
MLNSGFCRSESAGAGPSFGRGLGAVVGCAALMCSNGFVLGQTCGTQGQFCPFGTGCDDGDPCNGTESCSPPDILRFCRCGTPPCDDGIVCTQDLCTVDRRGRVSCAHPPVVCDDGLFCNGGECCFGSGGCTLCVPPPCNGFRFCDEANDRCANCLTDADCDLDNYTCYTVRCDFAAADCRGERCSDELFCGGRVLCDSIQGCRPGVPPCSASELCDESGDRCSDCVSSEDCADDDPCSIEVCDPNWLTCRTDPCTLAFRTPVDGAVLPVGEMVNVTGVGPHGLDLVLALDESVAIDATELAAMKSFCVSLVQGLLPFTSIGIEARVGVTAFGGGSRRILDLSFSRQTVLNAIEGFVQLDQYGDNFDTCVGCGIDDASANLITHGRTGATQAMIVITNSTNDLPLPNPAPHLAGALEAAAFHGQTIFAVGVGSWVGIIPELDLIATDVPGVQTNFRVNDFAALETILNNLFATLGGINVYTVDITRPDESQPATVVDVNGAFALSPWSILPGENTFMARINTLYGEKTASLTLIGVYPCANRCGDLTGDGAADLRDVAVFQNCFGGPSYSSAACACSDLNGDTRIDLFDHAALVAALQSPTQNAPPDCPAP